MSVMVREFFKLFNVFIQCTYYLHMYSIFKFQIVDLLQDHASNYKESPMSILIDEWSTMGKKRRPYIGDLLRICLQTGELSAASYIYKDILGMNEIGAADVEHLLESMQDNVWGLGPNNEGLQHDDDVDYSGQEENLETKIKVQEERDIPALSNTDEVSDDSLPLHQDNPFPAGPLRVNHIPFSYLIRISKNFTTLIGRGGFSEVYLGITEKSSMKIAIKKLKFDETKPELYKVNEQMMNNEIDQRPILKHPNIIDLLGYSNDHGIENACLLYPFMEGGTLRSKLEPCNQPKFLDAQHRIDILKGVAKGINHIHTIRQDKKIVHLDIKSTNILLKEIHDGENGSMRYEPKIIDFGIIRLVGDVDRTTSQTNCPKGTMCYMPPEGARGAISTKWDVWSYGVVMLEVITSLPPIDSSREFNHSIIDYYEEVIEDDIEDGLKLLEGSGVSWDAQVGIKLFHIVNKCHKPEKRSRADMAEVLSDLEQL